MAKDYTDITDLEVEAGKPLATSLMTRLRDNPIAGMQGDPDAKTAQATVWLGVDRLGTDQYGAITDETDTAKVLRPDGSGSVEWGIIAPPVSWNDATHVYGSSYVHAYGDTGTQTIDVTFAIANATDRASQLVLLDPGHARVKSVLDATPAFVNTNPIIRRDGAATTGTLSDSWGATDGQKAGTETFETQFGALTRGCVIVLGGTHNDGDPYISYAMGVQGVKITKDGSAWVAAFYGDWCLVNDSSGALDPANVYNSTATQDMCLLFTLRSDESGYPEKVRVGNTKGKGQLGGQLSVSGDKLYAELRLTASEGTEQASSGDNRGGAGIWWQSVLAEDQT